MKFETVKLKNGSLELVTYSKNDTKFGSNKLIGDIYKKINNFNDDIIYLKNIDPKSGYDTEDVLYNYMDEYCEHGLIFANDYLLEKNIPILPLEEAKLYMDRMTGHLYNSLFMHVTMTSLLKSDTGTIPDVFIYGNEDGHNFVNNYMGIAISKWDAPGYEETCYEKGNN